MHSTTRANWLFTGVGQWPGLKSTKIDKIDWEFPTFARFPWSETSKQPQRPHLTTWQRRWPTWWPWTRPISPHNLPASRPFTAATRNICELITFSPNFKFFDLSIFRIFRSWMKITRKMCPSPGSTCTSPASSARPFARESSTLFWIESHSSRTRATALRSASSGC